MCRVTLRYIHVSYRVGRAYGPPPDREREVPMAVFAQSLAGTLGFTVEYTLEVDRGHAQLVDPVTGTTYTGTYSGRLHCLKGGYNPPEHDPNFGLHTTPIEKQSGHSIVIFRPLLHTQPQASVLIRLHWRPYMSPLFPPPPNPGMFQGAAERSFTVYFDRRAHGG